MHFGGVKYLYFKTCRHIQSFSLEHFDHCPFKSPKVTKSFIIDESLNCVTFRIVKKSADFTIEKSFNFIAKKKVPSLPVAFPIINPFFLLT